MARQRNPNRDKAKQMWLEADGSIKLKDIAAELGVAENAVRKWKSEDKWEKERSDKQKRNAPNKKNATKRPGAPKGNKNAVGNAGGAPHGNTNALKHGGYSAIFWDTLSEEEQEMIKTMDKTVEQQLQDEIALLTVRERRILHNIKKYRDRPDGGEKKAELLHRLEEALTRCQDQKRRCLDTLHKIQSTSKSEGAELKSNNLIEALFANTKEDLDISDVPELIEAAEADDDLVELSEV